MDEECDKILKNLLGPYHKELLTGDGSLRQYVRLKNPANQTQTWIFMQLSGKDAQDLKEENYSWIKVREMLERSPVKVPNLLRILKNQGALLIEDLGDQDLEKKTQSMGFVEEKDFEEILNILKVFRGLEKESGPWSLKALDESVFCKELTLFAQEVNWSNGNEIIQDLSEKASQKPWTWVHRDFHSRNLMVTSHAPESLAVIDFQDAQWGPRDYDRLSICFDPYLPLSMSQRWKLWEKSYGVLGEPQPYWQYTLLQRLMKAMGSFGHISRLPGKADFRIHAKKAAHILLETECVNLYPEIQQGLKNLYKGRFHDAFA